MVKNVLKKISFILLILTISIGFNLLKSNNSVHAEVGTILEYATISEDTTWGIEGSPYTIKGEFRIEYGKTLTIEPGVEVIGDGNKYVEVNSFGNIHAVGTTQNPIKISNINIAKDWTPITLDFENVNINHSYINIDVGQMTLLNSVVTDSIFRVESAPQTNIEHNIFKNNSSIIFADNSHVNIINNTFYNNPNVVDLAFYVGTTTTNESNQFKGNNFLDVGTEVLSVKSSARQSLINLENTYFGTTNLSMIDKMINDGYDLSDYRDATFFDFLPLSTKYNSVAPFVIVTDKIDDNDTLIHGKVYGDPSKYYFINLKTENDVYQTTIQPGDFKIPISLQKPGSVIKITTMVSGSEDGVSDSNSMIVQDVTPPKTPIVNAVADNSTKVTGKAEAGSKITVKIGTKTYASTVSSSGTFQVIIPVQKAGTELAIISTDKAGNISQTIKTKVIDKTPPAIPSINIVKSTSKIVTGKSEVGSTVYLKVGSKVIGSAVTNSKGVYTIAIKYQKTGTILVVYAKDKAGNTSKSRSIKVIK